MSYSSDSNVRPRARMMGSSGARSMAVSSQFGSHTNRLRRFAARSARRMGDWDMLAVPTALLWSVDAYEAELGAEAIDDLMDQDDYVADLWP